MCFYYDDSDGWCKVWRESIVNRTRKEFRCESCQRIIAPGEQCLQIFYVFEGDPGGFRICNQCVQDGVTIHRREVKEGCTGPESWCPWDGVRHAMTCGPEGYRRYWDADWLDDVFFWPYGVPPAAKIVDLRQIPELGHLVKKKPEKVGAK